MAPKEVMMHLDTLKTLVGVRPEDKEKALELFNEAKACISRLETGIPLRGMEQRRAKLLESIGRELDRCLGEITRLTVPLEGKEYEERVIRGIIRKVVRQIIDGASLVPLIQEYY